MLKSLLTAFFTIFTTLYAFAVETGSNSNGPCAKLVEACKNAGFNQSILSDNKSLSKNCLKPLLNNQKVEGVSVDSKDLEACKTKKNELKSFK